MQEAVFLEKTKQDFIGDASKGSKGITKLGRYYTDKPERFPHQHRSAHA